MTELYGKCIYTESGLMPSETGGVISVHKKKFATCDIYFGITQSFFVLADCERYSHAYEFDDGPEAGGEGIKEVTSFLTFTDIGTCFVWQI